MAEINGFACARALFGILDFPLGSQKPGENQIEMKITHCALRRCFVLFMLTHNNLSLFFTHSLTFWRYRSLFLFSIFGFHFVRSRSCFFFTISRIGMLSLRIVCVRMPLSSYFMQKYFLCDAESFTISPVWPTSRYISKRSTVPNCAVLSTYVYTYISILNI